MAGSEQVGAESGKEEFPYHIARPRLMRVNRDRSEQGESGQVQLGPARVERVAVCSPRLGLAPF